MVDFGGRHLASGPARCAGTDRFSHPYRVVSRRRLRDALSMAPAQIKKPMPFLSGWSRWAAVLCGLLLAGLLTHPSGRVVVVQQDSVGPAPGQPHPKQAVNEAVRSISAKRSLSREPGSRATPSNAVYSTVPGVGSPSDFPLPISPSLVSSFARFNGAGAHLRC